MDLAWVNKKIARLKEMAIDKVDYHILIFMKEEIFEGIHDDEGYYLIDDWNYYFYWIELANNLKEVINLLIEYEISSNRINEMLQECVKIKSVIDRKLIKYQERTKNQDRYLSKTITKHLEYNFSKGIDNPYSYIQLIGNEDQQIKIIESLHDFLISWGKITVLIDEFKPHFMPTQDQTSLIPWKGYQNNIVYLFKLLFHNAIVINPLKHKKEKIILISSHFSNPEGKPLNPDSLSSKFSDSGNDDKGQPQNYIDILTLEIKET